jgi:hypothetical protein
MPTRKKQKPGKFNPIKTQKKGVVLKQTEIQHKQQTTAARRDFFKSLINH